MTVNDIDYNYFQELLRKANAFDEGLLDKSKFISVGYHEYIRTDEEALLNSYKTIADRAEYWGSAISAYCGKNNMRFQDFMEKYANRQK